MRLTAQEAAKKFIAEHFPTCHVALLCGSVVRGEGTERSDLDILIIDDNLPSAYRESFFEWGWPIEAFVHNRASYQEFARENILRARPSILKMCAEGIPLVDDGTVSELKQQAERILAKGPVPWTEGDFKRARYGITDYLEDLEGSADPAENFFIAGKLAIDVHEFVLRANNCWIGDGKWIPRALKRYDEDFCEEYVATFGAFYQTGEKAPLIRFIDRVLEPYGGRYFAGFSVGKR